MGFTVNHDYGDKFFAESIAPEKRGSAVSLRDMYGSRVAHTMVNDARVHDANFAFLSNALAKLHKTLYEPLYFVTWQEDVPFDTGGGFVDYVEYYTVNWAGIMNQNRNIVGNNADYIPRVNAGLNQNRVNVYTYEVAYDLRFVELEKMKQLTLQKSMKEIYNNVIVAGWDLFVQDVAYTGIAGATGLFNSDDKVEVTTIDNSATTGKGFAGLSDAAVCSFFNGIFEMYLQNSNMNIKILPDTILVPTFVQMDLVSRMSSLYTNTLYQFIIDHNLGLAQSKDLKLQIVGRPALNDLNSGKGRIVAYKKDKTFVRIDIPYPIQHYITLPNIDRMSYTSAFVGQVSAVQLPYNTDSATLGVVTYWDFTTSK
jgi:hypothetical protein